MESSKARTSTNNQLGEEYQVFLSFRGCDTRRGFTNCLYHALVDAGIRVFIDDEELRPGEEISGNLLQAIDDSMLYIPIFSNKYASSHWCLRELAKMVKNTFKSKEDGKKKVILPIFYDVKPDDVKLKTVLYNKAISDLEHRMEDQKKKFSTKDIETWRKALKEVDGTKGWELEKYSGHGDLIKTVVEEVVVRLKTRQRSVTKDLVGMEDQIVAISNLVEIDSEDVRLIGIYGMGGIGKTTLAKIIFNQLCPRFGRNCCFLDDVRETAKTKTLVELQKQLLSAISYSRVTPNINNIDHGINIIGETICNKKMLIVLDDVDKGSQIQNLIGDSLHPGTRVVVTTRDKSILNIRGFKYKFKYYEMAGLSNEDALKLFSRHAFNNDSPPANHHTLSKDIVFTTNGLPLALEAIGSSLFDQENKAIWEERLERLRKTPHEDVQGKLRISYDDLELDHKQIFLDIACFFIDYCNKTRAMDIWKYCGFHPEGAIDVLIKRCLIKVYYDNFRMHDQLRDLGRTIAKDECTRLWDRDDIICQMRSTEIKGSVHAIRAPWYVLNEPLTLEQIKRFPRLRYLSLRQGICKGKSAGCLSNLKWINLPFSKCLESPNMLHLENLIYVELEGLEMTKDGVDSLTKGARKLKVLTLDKIEWIRATPTFPEDSVLEKLTIRNCYSLKEIDCSIGKLRCLTHLRIEHCNALKRLPTQIGNLQNLRHLSLDSCSRLIELPDSLSRLVSLTELDVSFLRIRRLPNFVGRISELSNVDRIAEMPNTMSKLLHLQTLALDYCHWIQELPELPRSLTSLSLSKTGLLTVPNLSYLTNLVDLYLLGGSEIGFESNATQNCNLRWIGSLSKLRKLDFYFPKISAPTSELISLSLLEELSLSGVDLPTFEQLPSNLTILELNHIHAKEGILDRICRLEEEDTGCSYYSTKPTVAIRSSLRRLKKAKLYRHHDPLKVQLLDAIKLLERSRNQDSKSTEKLLCSLEESRSNEVQAPQLTDHWRGATFFPSSLKMLQSISLYRCLEVQDIQFVSTLESLRVFTVKRCISLKRLGGLSNLKNLKDLEIDFCESLQVVEGIDELECLQRMRIWACISMENVFHASSSKIPNECRVSVCCSGQLPPSPPYQFSVNWWSLHPLSHFHVNWESYKETILNETRQASYYEIETTDSDTETEDSIQKRTRKIEENREQDRVGKTTRKKKEGEILTKRLGAFAVRKIQALKNIF